MILPACVVLLVLVTTLAEIGAEMDMTMVQEAAKVLSLNRIVLVAKNGNFSSWKNSFARNPFRIVSDSRLIQGVKSADESIILDTEGFSLADIAPTLDNPKLGGKVSALILVSSDTFKFKFKINQQIYLINMLSGVIFEHYSVGSTIVTTHLAQYENASGTFSVLPGIDLNDFVGRRSDFHGVQLKVFVCVQPPYLFINTTRQTGPSRKIAIGNSGKEYYTVEPDDMAGIFWDLQVMMERELNFTSTYIQCEKRGWGDLLPNGSYSGMVGHTRDGDVDFIGTSLTIKASRYGAVDYLHPIGTETYALLLPSIESEKFDWNVFVEPFSPAIWLALVVIAAVAAIAFRLTWIGTTRERYKTQIDAVLSIPSNCWAIMCSYLGKDLPSNIARSQLTILFIALGGVLIWSAYRASLTSVLAARITRLPFDSLDGLLNSDYQMMLMGGGSIEGVFRSSAKESIHGRMYTKYFRQPDQAKDFVFHDEDKAIETLFSETNKQLTLWFVLETAYSYKNLRCELSVPWKSQYPELLSFATPKNNPYYPFIQRFILKHAEMGTLHKLNMLWKQQPPHGCLEDHAKALTPEKIATVFAIWAAGAVIALTAFVAERIVMRCNNRKNTKQRQIWLGRYVAKGSSPEHSRIKSMAATLAVKMNVGVADHNELISDLEELLLSMKQYYH